MEIRTVEGPGDASTDAYVRAHAEGTLFHESAWTRSAMEAYGHPARVLVARQGERTTGILPLVHVRSRLFGSRLVSSAFSVYGGILADGPAEAEALAAAARDVAREVGARYVELRNRRALLEGAPRKDLYVTFRIPVAGTFEKTLAALPKKMRQDLRRVEGRPLVPVEGIDLATFHRLYLHTLRHHGTPPFPRRWFEALARNLADRTIVLGIGARGRFVGASMLFLDRTSLLPYYTGVPRRFYDQRVTVALHARMLRIAIAHGCDTLDLGRSKRGTGAFEAKTHWGVEPTPLEYQYLMPPGMEPPNLSPANPKLRPLILGWRCLPIAATRVLGPPLNAGLA